MSDRVKAYKAALADAKKADRYPRNPGEFNAAVNAVGQAYRNLTRSDCAKLQPNSRESKDPKRKP